MPFTDDKNDIHEKKSMCSENRIRQYFISREVFIHFCDTFIFGKTHISRPETNEYINWGGLLTRIVDQLLFISYHCAWLVVVAAVGYGQCMKYVNTNYYSTQSHSGCCISNIPNRLSGPNRRGSHHMNISWTMDQ